jgi:hypothetical protein
VRSITEQEFARLCRGIRADADVIVKHNPIGTRDETLLWMLLGCLINYLSLTDIETPCFTGTPTAATYRDAIIFVVEKRQEEPFDAGRFLDELTEDVD